MSTFDVAAAKAAVDEHLEEFIEELQDLCRIRSRRYEPDQMLETADFIADSLRRWGGDAEVIPWEQSFPYVLGELPGGPKALLHFNHYDTEVEPTGDESAWISPPFAAEIHDGKLYARGVADDKGALMSRIHAAAAWKLSGQEAPVTSRFIFEGKTKLHSPGLDSFVEAHADRLRSEAALWENSWLDAEGRLLLKLGEKGILYARVTVQTLPRDLTSQNTVLLRSATTRLAHLIASLQDRDGAVLIPGFAEGATRPSTSDRELLARLEFDGDFVKRRAEVDSFLGDLNDVEAAEAIRMEPSLTVTGIAGGNQEDDVTLGIPATAWAKLEIRLVAGQDPAQVLGALQVHLEASGFQDATIDVMASNCPNGTDSGDPFVRLVADAAERAYGTEAVIEPYTQWIGNQSVVGDRPIVGVGVSRADSGVDGPNEHIRLDDYRAGILHVIEVMAGMAEQ